VSDFWERQRLKQQAQNPQPQAQPQNTVPWWAQGTSLVSQPQTVTRYQENDGRTIDGHDVSKAQILQGRAEECPMCPPDPSTGVRGNLYRPTPNTAMRCFDCGYVENNRFQSQVQGMVATTEGRAHSARQTASGGGAGSNYRGNIKSAGEAVGRLG
jgi:hypothetical protein